MLYDISKTIFERIESQWNEINVTVLTLAVLSIGSLFLWRLCAFTVLPLFRRREPKTLPYWIPCRVPAPASYLT
jgi:hypothetical protein